MGQIIGGAAKPKRCNISQLSQLGTPAAGEYILVSSDNSMNAAGQGNFDCYIDGNGTTAATALELKNIMPLGVFDLSAYTGSTYIDLAAALNAMNALPTAFKKGGMSVKFVQSSDNNSTKYVQYRLTADAFSANEADWQGVDAVPVAGSNNLVKSGGVYDKFFNEDLYLKGQTDISDNVILKKGYIEKTGVLTLYNTWYYCVFLLKAGNTIAVDNTGVGSYPSIGIAENGDVTIGDTVEIVTGKRYTAEVDTWIVVSAGTKLNSLILYAGNSFISDYSDEMPTPKSSLLVKSGGVAKSIGTVYSKKAGSDAIVANTDYLKLGIITGDFRSGQLLRYKFGVTTANISTFSIQGETNDGTLVNITTCSSVNFNKDLSVALPQDLVSIGFRVYKGAAIASGEFSYYLSIGAVYDIADELSDAISSVEDKADANTSAINKQSRHATLLSYRNNRITVTADSSDTNNRIVTLSIPQYIYIIYAGKEKEYSSAATVTLNIGNSVFGYIVIDASDDAIKFKRYNQMPSINDYVIDSFHLSLGMLLHPEIYTYGSGFGDSSTQKYTKGLDVKIDERTDESTIFYNNRNDNVGQNIIQSTRPFRSTTMNIDDVPSGTVIPDVLSLAVITDLHGAKANLKRFMSFCDKWSDYIDDKLSMGDVLTSTWASSFDFWDEVEGTEDILQTIGNHDVYDQTVDKWNYHAGADAYNRFIAPYVSNWGITQPADAATEGKCYYYKDYAGAKVRVIVIDCMYIGGDRDDTHSEFNQAQLDWFVAALSDAASNGLSVVCVCHTSFVVTQDGTNPFASLDSEVKSNTEYGDRTAYLNAVDTFINNGGEFICWLCGHTHFDYQGIVKEHTNQYCVTFEHAGFYDQYNGAYRKMGQKSQDSFNIISFDTFSKLIKIVRVGNNCDRWLRHKNYMTLNYQTKSIVTKG